MRCIGLELNGRTLDDVNGVGEPIRDETFLILLNPHHEPIQFFMPRTQGTAWELLLDSAFPERDRETGGRARRALRADRAQHRAAAPVDGLTAP